MVPLSFNLEHALQFESYRRRLKRAASWSNARMAIRIRAPLDVDALQRSVDVLVARHEIIRTAFVRRPDITEGEYSDRISYFGLYGAVHMPLHVCDVKPKMSVPVICSDSHVSEDYVDADIHKQYCAPFNYTAPPHLRVIAIQSPSDNLILLFAPAAVLDPASAAIICEDFIASYANGAHVQNSLSRMSKRYSDVASVEHEEFHSGAYARSIAAWRMVWRDYADTQIRSTDCPLSWPNPISARFGVCRTGFADALITAEESRYVWSAFESHALTMLAVAALARTIQEFTAKHRYPVWVAVENRDVRETARTVGPLASTHMMGVTLPLGSSPKLILDQVIARFEEIATEPQISYALLVHALTRSYERGISFSAGVEQEACITSEVDEVSDVAERVVLRWPLLSDIMCDTRVRLKRSGVVVSVAYSTALFTSDMIQKWLDAYRRHLLQLAVYATGASSLKGALIVAPTTGGA